jgi:hypothetical protein
MEKTASVRREQYRKWLILGSVYLMLIAFHGYRFGDEDMTETLSYALYLKDQSLYPQDLYIQAIGTNQLNERYPFTLLLSLFSGHLAWASFILHLVTTLLLLSGLWEFSSRYLRTEGGKILLLLATLIVTYHLNLGGNEIWYHYFVPSHLAKCIAVWGLVFWLHKHPVKAYSVVALATFAQPVVGAQLALLFFLTDLFQFRERGFKIFQGPLVFGLTAGIWITAVFTSHLISDQSITNREFYEIMETRLAHHYFPSYYPLRSWFILMPILVTACWIWKSQDKRLFYLFLWSFTGMMIYLTGIEVLEIPAMLSLQWFKITVWLKPLAILALLLWIESNLRFFPEFISPWILPASLASTLLLLSGFIPHPVHRPLHLPGTNYYTAEMDLALQMKEILPPDACIIIPPDVTGIRYFSQRSLFVDYKSNIHSKRYLAEASRRRKELYGMDLSIRRIGKDLVTEGKAHYQKLTATDFNRYRNRGVHYVMTTGNHRLELPVIAENSLFTLYQL